MKYVFNEDYDLSIEDRIFQINSIDKDSIDLENFKIDYNLKIINDFKELILANKESRFLIIGDYDCDGLCATSIMKKLLDDLGINSNYYIPTRFKDGYGLNPRIIDNAHNNNFDCLLCVDNGVAATEQVAYAKNLGLKVFIIDHHQYQNEPQCDGFLHPNLFPKEYSEMCAGGLCALLSNSFRYDELTTLYGGLSTISDMVNIFGYNRYMAKQMLELVKKNVSKPISMLLGDNEVTYRNISFNVIPKINAVSRLDNLMNVNYVVKFLLSDEKEALAYFDKIETINKARKEYSQQMNILAKRLIDINKNIIVVKHEEFKEGLCGLVANKLLDEYKKPTLVLAKVGDVLKGSGRSVPGVNMYEYLKDAKDLFEEYGGHELAVGLTIKEENYDKLIDYIENHELSYEEQYSDVIVLRPEDCNMELLDRIDSLRPFGTNFKEPLFGLKKTNNVSKYMVANKYPKFDFNENLSAISFKTNFVNKDFNYMIGRIDKDSYYPNKVSFLIEDLV